LNFKCPYQAKVMKVFEMKRKMIVFNPRITTKLSDVGFVFYDAAYTKINIS
jgi:hypothetical protein